MTEEEFDAFFGRLPDVFARNEAHKYLNGVLKPKSLINITNAGKGPHYFMVGKRAFYRRRDFLKWAREYYGIKGTDSEVQGNSDTEKGPGSQGQGAEGTA